MSTPAEATAFARTRRAEPAADGVGGALENGNGRPVKEWLALTASGAGWSVLAAGGVVGRGGVSPGRDR